MPDLIRSCQKIYRLYEQRKNYFFVMRYSDKAGLIDSMFFKQSLQKIKLCYLAQFFGLNNFV